MPLTVVWIALAVAALGHGFFWAAIINRLHGLRGPRLGIKLATVGCLAAIFGLPILVTTRLWADARPTTTNLPSAVPTPFNPFERGDWIAVYLAACVVVALLSLAAKVWIERHRFDRSVLLEWQAERRDLPSAHSAAGAKGRWLAALPGNEALSLSIDRKRLAIPRLPAELEGLSIAHLSDLHMDERVGRAYFIHLADQVNALRPDVICVTGDILERERCRPWLADTLGQLVAPLGVYFILGNHDVLIDGERTRQELIDLGLICLSGRWLRADWNGANVVLGGNELPWIRPAADVAALPPRMPEDGEFRLALCHSPDQFGWCRRAGVDLALAGHTHGGQVQLPILGILASPSLHGTRYACGVFRRGPTVMHVTRGVGGETPLRWHCPPEAALLTLTPVAPIAV